MGRGLLAIASLTSRFAGPLAFAPPDCAPRRPRPGGDEPCRPWAHRGRPARSCWPGGGGQGPGTAGQADSRTSPAGARRRRLRPRRGSERSPWNSVRGLTAAGLEAVLLATALPTRCSPSPSCTGRRRRVMVPASHTAGRQRLQGLPRGLMTDEAGRGATDHTPSDAERRTHRPRRAPRLHPRAPDGWTVHGRGHRGRLPARCPLGPGHPAPLRHGPARHLLHRVPPLHGVGGAVLPDLFEVRRLARGRTWCPNRPGGGIPGSPRSPSPTGGARSHDLALAAAADAALTGDRHDPAPPAGAGGPGAGAPDREGTDGPTGACSPVTSSRAARHS